MKRSLLLAALCFAGDVAVAQSNIAVFVAAAATANTSGSVIIVNPTTTAQSTPLNTYAIPVAGAAALRFSGTATSTGYLSNNADRTLVTFSGANTDQTANNINTYLTRGVGTFNAAGAYALAATYTGTSGNQTRSATTIDNTAYSIVDQAGIFTNGATSPSPSGAFRAVKVFGGTFYVGQASGTVGNAQVGTLSAPSGATFAGLPGLSNSTSFQDFYLIQSGSSGSMFDVLYTISTTSATAGTIAKYSLVGGIWTANGTYATAFGGFGLYAEATVGGATLFATSGTGATAGNNLLRLTDATGYNTPLSITTANNVTLYTAPAGTILKGVAMEAQTNPVPLDLVSFSARKAGRSVDARWTTSNEQALSHFILERSADGEGFVSIGRQKAAKTSGMHGYSASDAQPFPGKNFYRLACVDIDGTVSYSAVVPVFWSTQEPVSLQVTPNPIHSAFSLVHAPAVSGVRIIITDLHGRVLTTRQPAAGTTITHFEDLNLPAGTYFATLETSGQKQTTTFVR